MEAACYSYEPLNRRSLHFDLGYDARFHTTTEKDYWDAVRFKLGEILNANSHYERPGKVLLMADCIQVKPSVTS